MPVAFWCVFAAALLPYFAVGFAKAGPDYDNRMPRSWATSLDGRRARAHAAHQNGLEAFPFFASGVVIATLTDAPPNLVDMLSVIFVTARIGYTAAYIADKATLRSVLWLVGLGAVIGLFLAPLSH